MDRLKTVPVDQQIIRKKMNECIRIVIERLPFEASQKTLDFLANLPHDHTNR